MSRTSSCSRWHDSQAGAASPCPSSNFPRSQQCAQPGSWASCCWSPLIRLSSWEAGFPTNLPLMLALSCSNCSFSHLFFLPLPSRSPLPAVAASETCFHTAKPVWIHRHYPPSLPAQKNCLDNGVFRLHSRKHITPLCKKELRFGHSHNQRSDTLSENYYP